MVESSRLKYGRHLADYIGYTVVLRKLQGSCRGARRILEVTMLRQAFVLPKTAQLLCTCLCVAQKRVSFRRSGEPLVSKWATTLCRYDRAKRHGFVIEGPHGVSRTIRMKAGRCTRLRISTSMHVFPPLQHALSISFRPSHTSESTMISFGLTRLIVLKLR